MCWSRRTQLDVPKQTPSAQRSWVFFLAVHMYVFLLKVCASESIFDETAVTDFCCSVAYRVHVTFISHLTASPVSV